MDEQQIETKLKQMIAERLFLHIPPETIETEALLVKTYGIDSVCLLELVVGLEEVFGIALQDEAVDLRHFFSVAAMRDFVKARL